MDNAEIIRSQMISDLLASERALKEAAQQVIKDFRTVMFYVARQVDGWRVQDLQRLDPNFSQNWTPVQWQAFFEQSLHDPAAWRLNRDRSEEEYHLKIENDILRKQLTAQTQDIEDLSDELAYFKNRKTEQPSSAAAAVVIANVTEATPFYATVLARMKNWTAPAIPARFKQQFSTEDVRWRRQSLALAILAATGISTRLELDHLVGSIEAIKARSNSLRTTLDMLVQSKMMHTDIFAVHIGAFQSTLALVELTDDSMELCNIFGWNPVEGDWRRINRLHQGERSRDHTFGLLAFAMHARLRGWYVHILPQMEAGSESWQPDILLQLGNERLYVEVEMSDKENAAKWGQLAQLQQRVAFCTANNQQRSALVSDCKRLKLPGMATSLETLIGERMQDITTEAPLWAETWEAG